MGGCRRVLSRSAHWVRAIARHPANRGARVAAVHRAAKWHLRAWRQDRLEALVVVDGRTALVAHPSQFSAVWTIYNGLHEWDELQFCLRYLRPGDRFVDIGANIGIFSLLVGTRFDDVAITAIEPFPPVADDLERNLRLNDLRIEVIRDAVGSAPGRAEFAVRERDVLNRLVPDGATDTGERRIPVTVRTLDEVIGDRSPALIKIDVEGAELEVLRGARAVLERCRPTVLFEFIGNGDQFGATPAAIRSFFSELGYSIRLLDDELTPWDADTLPPVPNVLATTDVEAVRGRLLSPGGAPIPSPVPVDVVYRGERAKVRAPADIGLAPGRYNPVPAMAGAFAAETPGGASRPFGKAWQLRPVRTLAVLLTGMGAAVGVGAASVALTTTPTHGAKAPVTSSHVHETTTAPRQGSVPTSTTPATAQGAGATAPNLPTLGTTTPPPSATTLPTLPNTTVTTTTPTPPCPPVSTPLVTVTTTCNGLASSASCSCG